MAEETTEEITEETTESKFPFRLSNLESQDEINSLYGLVKSELDEFLSGATEYFGGKDPLDEVESFFDRAITVFEGGTVVTSGTGGIDGDGGGGASIEDLDQLI